MLDAAQRLIGLAHNVLAGLGEHLHGHVIRDQIALDQCAQELIFRLRRSRKADLDLLEAHLDQCLEELDFLVQTHRHHQRLIAVAQVHRAPDGRFFDMVALRPSHGRIFRCKILHTVFAHVFHPVPLLPEKPHQKKSPHSCHRQETGTVKSFRGTTLIGAKDLRPTHCASANSANALPV